MLLKTVEHVIYNVTIAENKRGQPRKLILHDVIINTVLVFIILLDIDLLQG